MVPQEPGRHASRVGDATYRRPLVAMLGKVCESSFTNSRTSREVFECHGAERANPVTVTCFFRSKHHSFCKSRRLKATPPRIDAARPIATMIPSASQFGATAGADAIWWNTEVSRIQWL